MSKVFFTSDTHYFHKNIIKYCSRNFENTQDMNRELIRRHNEVVPPDGTVFHLGDFGFHSPGALIGIRNALHGNIILIKGNHDRKPYKIFDDVYDYLEVNIEKIKVVLFHYPIESWNKRGRGSFHLFGHTHGCLVDKVRRRMDVGVDTNDLYPYSWQEIKDILLPRKLEEKK